MIHVLVAMLMFVMVGSKVAHAEEYFAKGSEERCMALNIYYESRSDNLAGKFAVSDVVLNRVDSKRFPDTICGVVKQAELNSKGIPKRNRCQFSWFCDGKADRPTETDSWIEAQVIAYQIMHEDKFRGITDGANHYHATYVNPRWTRKMDYKGQVGEHVFYKGY